MKKVKKKRSGIEAKFTLGSVVVQFYFFSPLSPLPKNITIKMFSVKISLIA